jgi:hypothetical protein
VLSWLGIARELTVGTVVNPVITHPLEQAQFEPEDTPKFLDDKGIRGSMTDLFYKTLGVESATFSFGGPNYLDSHGYFFDNVFGDLSTTCSAVTTPATISGTAAVGATQFTLSAAPPAAYTAGAYIQLGTYATGTVPSYVNEVIQISSTAASNIVNFINTPLRFAHPSSINGTAVTGSTIANLCTGTQFTHRFAALNSALGYGGAYGAQPPTHTFTDTTNIVNVMTHATYGTAPTNTYGARQYPSAVLRSFDFSGNAEQLLNIRMQGDSWQSTVATAPVTNTTTNSRPIPNWNSTVVILGNTVSSTGVWSGIGEFSISFKRATQVYWTVQGLQSPFVIARGPLTMDGTIQWDPANTETPLDLMLMNAQGPMQITMTNNGIPNSGTPFTLTFTGSQVANIKSKIMRNKALIGYSNSFEAVANSTDFGGSGGLGPGTLTLTNGTAVYTATGWMVNEGIFAKQLHLL